MGVQDGRKILGTRVGPAPPAPTFNVGHECAAFGPCANIEGGGAGGKTILRTTYGHIIAFT